MLPAVAKDNNDVLIRARQEDRKYDKLLKGFVVTQWNSHSLKQSRQRYIAQKREQKRRKETDKLRALATETTGQLKVLGLDGNTLGVDGSQVG